MRIEKSMSLSCEWLCGLACKLLKPGGRSLLCLFLNFPVIADPSLCLWPGEIESVRAAGAKS